MKLVFIHGWSVVNTNTYGQLPRALAKHAKASGIELDIKHIHLGRYVSFNDQVTVSDVARALDHALRSELPNGKDDIDDFSCITHSTGGPVVRQWLQEFQPPSRYGCPLRHLVMLAPANHGSPLAVLGKARVGRIKAWLGGVEPGQNILNWLSMGSEGQWQLNGAHFRRGNVNRPFEFVLTGEGLDPKFYDFINSYLDEPGSDGVVRVVGANMNGRLIELQQTRDELKRYRNTPRDATVLKLTNTYAADATPLAVFAEHSHSGRTMGIMAAKRHGGTTATAVVSEILGCLSVDTPAQYRRRFDIFMQQRQQRGTADARYCQVVFNIRDDQGRQFDPEDYDLLLLGGQHYQPAVLPSGFLQDRQMNNETGRLIFYLNHDVIAKVPDGKLGIRVVPRPADGFAYYRVAEFRSGETPLNQLLRPDETTYLDICLVREVDHNVLRLGAATDKPFSFRRTRPARESVE